MYGIKVDYLSPTLYFLDLIWVGLLVNNIFKKKVSLNYLIEKNVFWLILILINILIADRWQVSIYKWFRLWQFWWWVKYIGVNKEKVLKILPKIIVWWVVFEVILGLGQVVNGGNIGGIFYWLGERRFTYMTPGIARISWFGDNFVRAYGTFSHPNSLAGFLLVVGILFNKTRNKENNKICKWVVNWLIILGIIITGSRLVWLVLGLVIVVKIRLKIAIKMIIVGIGLMMIGMLLENKLDWLGGWSSESVLMRMNLNKVALKMIVDSPIFGVGLGNFLVKLPDKLSGFWIMQPVHNIGLLAISELGLVGFGWIAVFLHKTIDWKKYGLIWLVVLVTGMFDHYWLSLPQNWLLLSVVAGLSFKD